MSDWWTGDPMPDEFRELLNHPDYETRMHNQSVVTGLPIEVIKSLEHSREVIDRTNEKRREWRANFMAYRASRHRFTYDGTHEDYGDCHTERRRR